MTSPMKKYAVYPLLGTSFALISCGTVVAAYTDSFGKIGYRIFWMLLPMTAIFLCAVAANIRYGIPKLLMRHRYLAYCLFTFMLAYLVVLLALTVEYGTRQLWGLPFRISDYTSPWILVDCFSNCVLLFLIFLGIGAWQLYLSWRKENEQIRRLSESLKNYIYIVNERLNPSYIFDTINRIQDLLEVSAQEAMTEIRKFSVYLRKQLYEMPSPPLLAQEECKVPDLSFMTGFIIGRRYHLCRHLIFQIILALISLGVFFNAPDAPEFTFLRLEGAVSMFIFLNVIAYVNVLWLFRRFRKHRNLRRYCIGVGVLLVGVLLPMITIEVLTYEPNVYTQKLPPMVMVLATAGSMATLLFYVCGISGGMLLQEWIAGRRRMTLLRAETVRQEYAYLRKQINPHFLFNVLNNVGILAFEDPIQTRIMLADLKKLLEYQFEEMERERTQVGREIYFLQSYLELQKSRIEPFEYSIEAFGEVSEIAIPSLILITFVENAVKHSRVVNGHRDVTVSITGDRSHGVRFVCTNTFKQSGIRQDDRAQGIGLVNTIRRLELLYGNEYSLSQRVDSDRFITELILPENELYNN